MLAYCVLDHYPCCSIFTLKSSCVIRWYIRLVQSFLHILQLNCFVASGTNDSLPALELFFFLFLFVSWKSIMEVGYPVILCKLLQFTRKLGVDNLKWHDVTELMVTCSHVMFILCYHVISASEFWWNIYQHKQFFFDFDSDFTEFFFKGDLQKTVKSTPA